MIVFFPDSLVISGCRMILMPEVENVFVPNEDVEEHSPKVGAEKAEIRRYESAKKKDEIISGVRTHIDSNK